VEVKRKVIPKPKDELGELPAHVRRPAPIVDYAVGNNEQGRDPGAILLTHPTNADECVGPVTTGEPAAADRRCGVVGKAA
jgi:hypothetical protein